MKRIPVVPDLAAIPEIFHSLLRGAQVYDSSCSKEARVLFIDREGGLFLKSAPKGTLAREAEMTAYFHQKRLGAQVLAYRSLERDWLLTTRVPGEDCTHAQYLSDPKRLCDLLGERLRTLHELPAADCPAPDRTKTYLHTVYENHRTGAYDHSAFPDSFGYASPEDAITVVRENAHRLKSDVLLHGDYCLPNVMLDDWRFSGFIDVGNGGIGDRHIDLFWGIWTLWFNLKTDRYANRFLDAYGRDLVDRSMLRVIAACETFG